MIPVTAFAGDIWTKEDTARQVLFVSLQVADWLQTKEIVRRPDRYERNIILGSHPKQNTIDLYFLTTTALHTTIAYYLPKKYRMIWQYVWITIETGCVYHNHKAGIRINF